MAEAAAKSLSYLPEFFLRVLSLTRPHLEPEAMRMLAIQATARSMKYAQDHPYATAFAALNFGLAPILGAGWLTAPLLNLVGFGPLGPVAGLNLPYQSCLRPQLI